MPTQFGPKELVKFSKEFLALFAGDPRKWPKYDALKVLFRKSQKGALEHAYRDLRRGDAAEYRFAEFILTYVRERYQLARDLANPIEAAFPSGKGISLNDDYKDLYEKLPRSLSDADDMYVHNPDIECLGIADACLRQVGRYAALAKNGAIDVLALGQNAMQVEREELAKWLRMCSKAAFRSIVYAVVPEKKKGRPSERIAVSVLLPVAESFAALYCSGKGDALDLAPNQILSEGRYIFAVILAELEAAQGKDRKTYNAAVSHCLTYQSAYFTRNLEPLAPVIFCPAPRPDERERMLELGWMNSGVCVKDTNTPILTLGKSDGAGDERQSRLYSSLIRKYRRYREENEAEWLGHDLERKRTKV
jgi:hypothetical protein